MQQAGPNPYLKTKILTATPEELRLMLYDGAIKFCRQAQEALAAENFEGIYNGLSRAKKIVLELSSSLQHDVEPDLCSKLSALYSYIYRLLVEASLNRTEQEIDEAIKLLTFEKETWQMLMSKLAPQHPSSAMNVAGAQQTAISSLSTNA